MEENSFEGLVLKELPKHLKYIFLEEERSNSSKFDYRERTESGGNS